MSRFRSSCCRLASLAVLAMMLSPGSAQEPAVDELDADGVAIDDDSGPVEIDWISNLLQPPMVEPIQPMLNLRGGSTEAESFGFGIIGLEMPERSILSQTLPSDTLGTSRNVILGREGFFRSIGDTGKLLDSSNSSTGISSQLRNPQSNDPRVRGDRTSRLLASGSYWVPARQDLDTMLNKIDTQTVSDIVVVKGPYSVMYGPGFRFVDFQLRNSPRYANGLSWNGATSLEYRTNGSGWYGRQTVWGGAEAWGYRVGYGHRTGNDYTTGLGTTLPTSYNSRDLDLAFGGDLTCDSRVEFNYLRLDQTGMEYPGLVFDNNFLATNAFEATYIQVDQAYYDRLVVDGWYNETYFAGDTLGAGKNMQIPSLRFQLAPFPGFAITDVNSKSAGYRAAFSWGGDVGEPRLTAGTDLIHIEQELNDIEDPGGMLERNFPIPKSHSTDIGFFVDYSMPVNDRLTFGVGARFDYVSTDARNEVPGFLDPATFVPTTISAEKGAPLNQNFTLLAANATALYEVNECWTLNAGFGVAQRAPTLTELYAAGSFIGSLQPGLNFLEGDPLLEEETIQQVDVGITGDLGAIRVQAGGYYSHLNNYIIYEDIDTRFFGTTPSVNFQNVAYGNTDLAVILGADASAECDLTDWLTAFGILSYVEGRDLTRNAPTRMAQQYRQLIGIPEATGRSYVDGVATEWLPGIPPLASVVGLRLQQPCVNPAWGLELSTRMVNRQSLNAATLFEQQTSGFSVWNLRGYMRPTDRTTVTAGVENFTDRYYREHLDFRAGLGVFRPGINFYFASETRY